MMKTLLLCFLGLLWRPVPSSAATPLEMIERYTPGDETNLPVPEKQSGPVQVPLEKTQWAGREFAGQVVVAKGRIVSVSIRADDVRLPPADIRELFDAMGQELEKRHGKAVTFEVPNFQDGSEVKNLAKIWLDDTHVLKLDASIYSRRGSVSLFSSLKERWLEDMGADTGEFIRSQLPAMTGTLHSVPPAAHVPKGKSAESDPQLRQDLPASTGSEVRRANAPESAGAPWWLWLGCALVVACGVWLTVRACRRRT